MPTESIPLTGSTAITRTIKAGQVIEVLSDQILRLVVKQVGNEEYSTGGTSAGVEVTVGDEGFYAIYVIPYDEPFSGVLNIRDPEPLPE